MPLNLAKSFVDNILKQAAATPGGMNIGVQPKPPGGLAGAQGIKPLGGGATGGGITGGGASSLQQPYKGVSPFSGGSPAAANSYGSGMGAKPGATSITPPQGKTYSFGGTMGPNSIIKPDSVSSSPSRSMATAGDRNQPMAAGDLQGVLANQRNRSSMQMTPTGMRRQLQPPPVSAGAGPGSDAPVMHVGPRDPNYQVKNPDKWSSGPNSMVQSTNIPSRRNRPSLGGEMSRPVSGPAGPGAMPTTPPPPAPGLTSAARPAPASPAAAATKQPTSSIASSAASAAASQAAKPTANVRPPYQPAVPKNYSSFQDYLARYPGGSPAASRPVTDQRLDNLRAGYQGSLLAHSPGAAPVGARPVHDAHRDAMIAQHPEWSSLLPAQDQMAVPAMPAPSATAVTKQPAKRPTSSALGTGYSMLGSAR